ncbi:MAG: hypothetical protein ACI4SG_01035 [Oligosphaeraceae bacterium]
MRQRFSSFLGPRIVIYTIVVLAMAWVFWRQESRVARSAPPPASAPEESVLESPPAHAAAALPLLVALGEQEMREELEAVVKLAENSPDLRNCFTVVAVTLENTEETAMYLQAFQCQEKDLPLAILFDGQGREMMRGGLPRTPEELTAFRRPLEEAAPRETTPSP